MAAALLSIFIMGCGDSDGGPGPLPDPYVTDVMVTTPGGTTEVTKGDELQLGAIITWSKGSDTVINPTAADAAQISQWIDMEITSTVFAGGPAGTRISPSGLLTVALGETAASITVRGTYKDNTTLFRDITLTVKNPSVTPTVTSISITGNDSVDKGSSIILTSNVVTNPATADKSVTWSITTNGHEAGTSLSATTGSSVTLSVDANESKTSITVKIVSNLDGSTTDTKTITVNSPSPEPTDFTTEANARLLGLYPGSGGYEDGTEVISAMEGRINSSFYDIVGSGFDVSPDDVFGATGVKADDIDSSEPGMAWFILNNYLVVYGAVSGTSSQIVFNVAVINETTGEGWITGDGDHTPYGDTYLRTYNTRSEKISISDLTENNISTATQLKSDGYKVYVIVRWTDNFLSRDFNDSTDFYNDCNVISVTVP
jgi:hypothetical protein